MEYCKIKSLGVPLQDTYIHCTIPHKIKSDFGLLKPAGLLQTAASILRVTSTLEAKEEGSCQVLVPLYGTV